MKENTHLGITKSNENDERMWSDLQNPANVLWGLIVCSSDQIEPLDQIRMYVWCF